VITHDFWTRRFNRRASIVGETMQIGAIRYEIIGVAPADFVGTEPGRLTDIFVPSTMNTAALNSPGWSWFRIWIRPKNGADARDIQQILQPGFAAEHKAESARLPPETTKARMDAFLNEEVALLPAASGASGVKKQYRGPLLILMALVALVLLVACANVANLLIGQALTRVREMALRLSIGAGRGRLVQLMMIESLLLAAMATAVGWLIAEWSAPVVVSMLAPPDDPVRLVLDADRRALAFGATLTLGVTLLFGLIPALRAASAKPMQALRGGDDPRDHRRLTQTLVAAQMAFSVAVLFVAGLFVTTFSKLSNLPLGFADSDLIVLDTDARSDLPPETWAHIVETLRNTPGVDAAAAAGWLPLSGNSWRGRVTVKGRTPPVVPPYFVSVGVEYFKTMGIPIRDGRDFRVGDKQPTEDSSPIGIVNEAFARVYFDGRSPVGQQVNVRGGVMEIVGLVGDAVYRDLREPIRPQVYLPLETRSGVSIVVRTTGDPASFGPQLGRQIAGMSMGLRADSSEMSALVRRQLLRERVLAILSMFFAGVAVLLAAVGLYGVLNHAVIRQRKEIGIRLALGSGSARVVAHVTGGLFLMSAVGASAGLLAGMAGGRFVESLLFGVNVTGPAAVLAPVAALLLAAAAAALPAALRASRLDPSQALRSE
jgi:predicted permease